MNRMYRRFAIALGSISLLAACDKSPEEVKAHDIAMRALAFSSEHGDKDVFVSKINDIIENRDNYLIRRKYNDAELLNDAIIASRINLEDTAVNILTIIGEDARADIRAKAATQLISMGRDPLACVILSDLSLRKDQIGADALRTMMKTPSCDEKPHGLAATS